MSPRWRPTKWKPVAAAAPQGQEWQNDYFTLPPFASSSTMTSWAPWWNHHIWELSLDAEWNRCSVLISTSIISQLFRSQSSRLLQDSMVMRYYFWMWRSVWVCQHSGYTRKQCWCWMLHSVRVRVHFTRWVDNNNEWTWHLVRVCQLTPLARQYTLLIS